ncbi:MAG: class I SAM-dependent methyltransferase [Mycobacteriales bacterium]
MTEWASGENYEPFIGRWSRLVAPEFITWLAVPEDRHWLDVGCGTGALTATILENAAPAQVVGVDPSPGFTAYARQNISDVRARFDVGDAQELPVQDAAFDVVVSGLVLNFVPDRARAMAEMRRAGRRGAVVAAYVWDYAGEMQLLRHFWDTAVELDPAAHVLHEGNRFDVCSPDRLRATWSDAGLANVQTRPIDVSTVFADFDDYWTPFLSGQAPAPSYAMSLRDADRSRLREALRRRLPIEADGPIRLTARAWAVRGTN